jgi:arylsulfatase A-like enzyme
MGYTPLKDDGSLDRQPHIILIMTDQQRFDTLAAWGHEHMVTPNMDRLAHEGVSFRQAFCPGATCISSRAAVFTGMYPHTTGVYTFDRWAEHRNWVQDLADHGYWCVNVGKMHFSPRDVTGGFHERTIVENPTNMTHARGGSDDDWGRYLTFHGQQRPLDRNHTDRDWMSKHQGVPWNLWSDVAYERIKNEMLRDLLDWLAGSVYWNAGYKRTRARQTRMRWPVEGDVNLHGPARFENPFRERW